MIDVFRIERAFNSGFCVVSYFISKTVDLPFDAVVTAQAVSQTCS